ncbi:hypothetical protein NMY22_g18059 [Coprinellus aureogranulatus]|nr:hypothetical protein NMY22_g18059 [Coprinellus aureogranulatus]
MAFVTGTIPSYQTSVVRLTDKVFALPLDAAPRIQLTPAQVLQDENRLKRLEAALSGGIFTYVDGGASVKILNECLKICGGSDETLSELLQTKFLIDHTAFYWAIVNRPHSKRGVPPFLVQLLSACEELNQETQEDIFDAFHRNYESDLYIAVRQELAGIVTHNPYNTSFFQSADDRPRVAMEPRVRINLSHTYDPEAIRFSFHIPKFFNRMLVEEQIVLNLPAAILGNQVLFSLTAIFEPGALRTGRCCTFKVKATRGAATLFSGSSYREGLPKGHSVDLQLAPRNTRKDPFPTIQTTINYTSSQTTECNGSLPTNKNLDELYLELDNGGQAGPSPERKPPTRPPGRTGAALPGEMVLGRGDVVVLGRAAIAMPHVDMVKPAELPMANGTPPVAAPAPLPATQETSTPSPVPPRPKSQNQVPSIAISNGYHVSPVNPASAAALVAAGYNPVVDMQKIPSIKGVREPGAFAQNLNLMHANGVNTGGVPMKLGGAASVRQLQWALGTQVQRPGSAVNGVALDGGANGVAGVNGIASPSPTTTAHLIPVRSPSTNGMRPGIRVASGGIPQHTPSPMPNIAQQSQSPPRHSMTPTIQHQQTVGSTQNGY